MLRRIRALIHKEWLQIFRDPVALLLLLALPVIILFIFGYAIDLDVTDIRIAVYDTDRTPTSRALIDRFVTSGYFTHTHTVHAEEQILSLLNRGTVKAVIKIPTSFRRDIYSGKSTPVQVLIDGTDSNTANIIMSYVKAILQTESMRVVFQLMNDSGSLRLQGIPGLDVRPNIWYNPELKSLYFLVPGIIGIIITVVGGIRMSISLVKEKEQGTIESLMVSPIRPFELMVGKITPYIVIVFIDLVLIVVVGQWWFAVPFRGSLVLFFLLSFVFLGSALGMGLLISAFAKSSQVAWLGGFLITILPSILLSGFIFPIESMPFLIRIITCLLPIKYFLVILRGIILKGVGIEILYPEAVVLAVFAAALLGISSMKFKKRY